MPLEVFQPFYHRLEKHVASRSIPKAHTVPNRKRLADHPLSGPPTFDHSAWDRVLKKHVYSDGTVNAVTGINVVDYAGVTADPDFATYLDQLDRVDPASLPPAEQLTLWMNAYNALCVNHIVNAEREKPGELKSILHLKKGETVIWDQEAGRVGGKPYSLNQIEHECLRKSWAEPAVHACIVCASASCPNLRPEAFVADRLAEQMRDQVADWLKNATKGLHLESQRRIHISRIFLWFADDFGGFDGARRWIISHGQVPSDASKALRSSSTALRYFYYDWAVNRKA